MKYVIQLGTDGSQSISVPEHMLGVAREIVSGIPSGTPNRAKLILSAINQAKDGLYAVPEDEYEAKVSAIEDAEEGL